MNCEEAGDKKVKKEPNVYTLNLHTPLSITETCFGNFSIIVNSKITVPAPSKQVNEPS